MTTETEPRKDEDAAELQRRLSEMATRITFGPCLMALSLTFEESRKGFLTIRATLDVSERDTGEPIKVQTVRTIEPQSIRHHDHLAYIVRKTLIEIVTHEIDEHFFVDGKLLNDPHKGE